MAEERRFEAFEYGADARAHPARFRFSGTPAAGWRIERNDALHLELGRGYRLLACSCCGVCSTDLDRHFLPFALPQITGHEVVARDAEGRRYAVEINASHRARGVEACPYCGPARGGEDLATHCPERTVLGIDRLPGGFAPWLLAPVEGLVPLPDSLPDETAALVEPFAAALHGARRSSPRPGDTVAVLGTRRLGLLAVAALASEKRRGADIEILALSRHAHLRAKAVDFGADRSADPEGLDAPVADLLIDTTGSAEGFERALALARREVHLKSTHGQPAGGLANATALVVDELGIAPFGAAGALERDAARNALASRGLPERPRVAWLSEATPPRAWRARAELVEERDALRARRALATGEGLPGADLCVVDDLAQADAAIRPSPDDELALVRPRGWILLRPAASPGAPLARALARGLARGLTLSSSRCGDFRSAVERLAHEPELTRLGDALITHRIPARELPRALELARSPECIKALVCHDPA